MRKQQHAKTVNQTFSIPIQVSKELHTFIKRREMSHFVSEAIKKELDLKKQYLRECYAEANKDEAQLEVTSDWETTVEDGSDDW